MPSLGGNTKEKWFHGKASRTQVEDLVQKAGIDGSFAVRASDSVPGGYTLSLLSSNRVFTYRILPTDGKYAIETNNGVQKRKFVSVDEMIDEYKYPGNGLACALTNPVGKSSIFSRIKKDVASRRTMPSRTPSAPTMPLPPIPTSTPGTTTSPPPEAISTPPQPTPVPRLLRANSANPTINSHFNPAGILAVISGSTSTPPLPPRPARLSQGEIGTTSIPPRPSHSPPPPPSPAQEVQGTDELLESSNTCVVCLDAKLNAFFQACGHVCCCMDCAKKIKECPLCRKKISKFHKAYIP